MVTYAQSLILKSAVKAPLFHCLTHLQLRHLQATVKVQWSWIRAERLTRGRDRADPLLVTFSPPTDVHMRELGSSPVELSVRSFFIRAACVPAAVALISCHSTQKLEQYFVVKYIINLISCIPFV